MTQSRGKPNIVTVTNWTPDLSPARAPRYLAIADALADDVTSGRLKAGDRLPTHRELADRLGVTVGTVTRGYAEAARRGLVGGEVGRGTFVRGAPELPLEPGSSPAALIDLSLNLPPTLGDERDGVLARTLTAIAREADLAALLEYTRDAGATAHREAGASWIGEAGLEVRPEQVLVSSGSQHGLTSVLTGLLRPGDLVLTESLTYPGMKTLAALLNLRLQGVGMDAEGLRADALEAACRSGAKALYCIPTIQNPTGAVMGEERRRDVARIARAHGLLVVEDDVHGLLAEEAPPPLSRFAPETSCYLLSTAKTLAPGLRTGFIAAPAPLVPRIAAAIRATTWMAAPLMAEIVARWIQDGTARRLLKRRREEARARQKLAASVLRGLDRQAHPAAHHLWLSLPDPWRSETFAEAARRRGVLVTPAQTFVVGRAAVPHAVRVAMGAVPDRETLGRGLALLAETLKAPSDAAAMIV